MKLSSKKFFYFFYAFAAIFGLYCYNPWVLFFQNDDFIHIPLSKAGKLFQRNSFRPVCDLSVILDQALYAKNAPGYHLTNLVLHIFCCVLVFFVSKEVFKKYSQQRAETRLSIGVALLFFGYATHSEAVLWVLGRSAIIGLIFSLLFLLQYLKREISFGSIISYTLFLILALLSYESSFTLPVLVVLFFIIDKKRKDFIHAGIVMTAFATYLIARWLVTGELYGTYELNNIGGSGYVTAIQNFAKLIMRSFIPAYTQGVLMVGLFAAVAVALLVVLLRHRRVKPLMVLLAIFMVSLSPYLSLGIDAHGYEGERFLYFPLFFLCLLIVWAIDRSFNHDLHRNVAFSFVLLIHCFSLQIAAKNFRLAGEVNKLTVQAVRSLPAAVDTLYVQQLPQAQNGALMMRDGFEEAVRWLGSNDSMKVVIISKRSEWMPLMTNYQSTAFVWGNNNALKTAHFYFSDSLLTVSPNTK